MRSPRLLPVAPRWWRRRAGVRVRTALTAAVTVGAVLAVGSVLFVLLLQRNLAGAVDEALLQQAQTLADTVAQEGSSGVDLQRRVGDVNVSQLLDAGGAVLESSPGLDGQPALSPGRPPPGRHIASTRGLPRSTDEPYRVLALGTRGPSGRPLIVVVAQSLEGVEASARTAAGLLLVGAPLLLLLVAAVTYWLSGRALRPVEAMRRQVADIDARTLGASVPLPEARDEVWRLGWTLNRMLGRLESAATEQRRFVSDASHELRSPLAALRASVEVAQAHPEVSDWNRTGEVVLEESTRLERLVEDLLLLARADERGLQLGREDVDLDDVMHAEVERLRATTSLVVRSQIEPVRVLGDHHRLQRAVRNLVDNASRHAHTSVQLSLSAQDGMATLDVTDDGPGVAHADRLRVFDRFVRLDDSRTRSLGGTGLGLAIVHQIAQAHGGDVAFQDVATGSVVRLRLPIRRPKG